MYTFPKIQYIINEPLYRIYFEAVLSLKTHTLIVLSHIKHPENGVFIL